MDATLVGGGDVLRLGVDSCSGDPVPTVEESSAEVRVEVVSTVHLGGGPACQDVVEVALASPLGDREVVDGSSGQRLEVVAGAEPARPGVTHPLRAGPLPPGPLAARDGHAAAWTGREMVIWGGALAGEPDELPPLAADGAAYDPAARTWRPLAPSPLIARTQSEVVWTGEEVVVWGGLDAANQSLRDGARYRPADDTWELLPTGGPADRPFAQLEWTGDELLLFGGQGGTVDGARLRPDDEAWTAIAAAPLDGADGVHVTWAGDRLVMLADFYEDRATVAMSAWDPATDTWTESSDTIVATGWAGEALWDGRRLIVASQVVEQPDGTVTAGALDPATGTWTPLALPPPDVWAELPTVWTGEEVLFVGTGSGDAAAYDPEAATWRDLPSFDTGPRYQASAVWADDAVLVWGGNAGYEGRDLRADGIALPTSGT